MKYIWLFSSRSMNNYINNMILLFYMLIFIMLYVIKALNK